MRRSSGASRIPGVLDSSGFNLIKIVRPLIAGAGIVLTQGVEAGGFFLPADDSRLRDDISLLVDERVIHLPITDWPMVRETVAEAVARVDSTSLRDAGLLSVLARVKVATHTDDDAKQWRLRELSVIAGQPGLLRDDATVGRENLELQSIGGASTDRYNVRLSVTGVVDPADGQPFRLDGSDISMRRGNWLLSANQMGRWWGPGRDGSLILSTNARPMPGLSLHRVYSKPADLPLLRWLGPWRFTGFVGLMENERPDVDRPLFMGMRVSFKPSPLLELGLSRSAQFCGKHRPCDLKTFGRVLIGQDNAGRRGLDDPALEPGNQMAGFDARLTSPFRALPLVLHAQMIGEDNSDTGIPLRYLGQFGAESWAVLKSGSVLRARLEFAETSVRWYTLFNPKLQPDVSYRQTIFFAGYRYRGRNIGHATDADSLSGSLLLSLTNAQAQVWAVRLRHARLDWYGDQDPYNTVTLGRNRYNSIQLSWDGTIRQQGWGAHLGHESQAREAAGKGRGWFGFVQWRKAL